MVTIYRVALDYPSYLSVDLYSSIFLIDGFMETSVPDETAGRLDANEFRDFWISWYHGFVEVGEGAIAGDNVS